MSLSTDEPLSKSENTEHIYNQKISLLKDIIDEAYSLILSGETVLHFNAAPLRHKADMLFELCYDAEDMVGEEEFEMRNPISFRTSSGYSPKNEKKLLSVTTSLTEAISSLRILLKITEAHKPSSMSHNKSRPQSGHRMQVSLGRRYDHVASIIEELTSKHNIESLGVSIVGMNGVGKSALAAEVLNHELVAESFRHRLWASISGPFNPEEISKQLLEAYNESSQGSPSKCTSIDQLLLDGPWCIVLDNLSDVTNETWSDFQSSFPPSLLGKIIITTVDRNVSQVTQTASYDLYPLDEEDCCDIISDKISDNVEASMCHSCIRLVLELSRKCGGLPLVANFVGSLLNNCNNWRTMWDRDLWEVPEFKREILPQLAWTYFMLKPHHLRKCFAYFSLFPSSYKFYMEDLIQLWIGEGFIQCREESSLERVGKEYFETFVRWSILVPLPMDRSSNVQVYGIHEFTPKLAKLVASETCFFVDAEGASSRTLATNTRHLSWSCRDIEQGLLESIEKLKGLRTLLPLGDMNFSLPATSFRSLKYVRVLSFKCTDVVEIPVFICKLKFLRYLDISHTRISWLPEKVCEIYNLRFLKLQNTCIRQLPMHFEKLINLRYIDWDLDYIRYLSSFPPSIGNLTNLQRLPLFEVGGEEGYTIKELCNMVHLEGSIRITNLQKVRNQEEAMTANLCSKKSLVRIEFTWTSNSNPDISEEVLIGLRPHESLRILQINNYCGRKFPQWLEDLHQLVTIVLTQFRYLPALGHLPRLQNLEIVDCPQLISLPSLELLTSLNYLVIFNCEALALLPRLPSSLTILSINRCYLLSERCQPGALCWSMLKHIPKLWIDDKPISKSSVPGFQVFDESPHLQGSPFQAGRMQRCDQNLRKSSRWTTLSRVFYATMRMKANVMEKYTSTLVNNIAPSSEAETCRQLLTMFPRHLEMMHYCLLFPKDYKFDKERLIQLWSAAGFLKNECKEDIHHFFDFLLKENFIATAPNDTLSGTEMFNVNSLKLSSVFDKLGAFENCVCVLKSANVVINRFACYKDVCVTSGELDEVAFELVEDDYKLRSVLFLNGSTLSTSSYEVFSALGFLKILDLSCTGLKELPTSVCFAEELRYLDLSWTLIESLPDCVVNLCELQTLKLEGCAYLFCLPKEMNQLVKLRHLDFDILGQLALTSMPEGIGSLVELRTLWAFIVGEADGCNINELKNMNLLSGKLCLSRLENVKAEDAREAALINKGHLSHLDLGWSNFSKKIEGFNYVEVLEGLEPDKCLKELEITCFPGPEFPKWVGDPSYSNLVSISLYKCEDCEHLPTLGRLPNLQELEIIGMNGVRVIDDLIQFLKLQKLSVHGMRCLEEWTGLDGEIFPSVENLIIEDCPKWSRVLSSSLHLQSLLHLEIFNCPMLESLPEGLLSPSLKTLIIQDCPFGKRFQDGGEDRSKITKEAKVWIFLDDQTSEENGDKDDDVENDFAPPARD